MATSVTPDATASSPAPSGFLESDVRTDKQLAKLSDTAVKTVLSAPQLSGYLLPLKLLQTLTKSWSAGDGAVVASKELDEGHFSGVAWELAGLTNAVAAGSIAGLGASDLLVMNAIRDRMETTISPWIIEHVAANSGFKALLTGIWTGKPFYSSDQKRELLTAIKSQEFRSIFGDVAKHAVEGAPQPLDTTTRLADLFKNAVDSKRFFRTPELPTREISEMLRGSVAERPGLVLDGQKLRTASKVVAPIASNVLPVVSVLLDGKSAVSKWQKYHANDPTEAEGTALASLVTSGISLTGAVCNAIASNTRVSPSLVNKRSLGMFGAALMCLGAGGSYILERGTTDRISKKVGDKV